MSDLWGPSGLPHPGRGDGVRPLPPAGAQQDPVPKGPLCLQHLPHPGPGPAGGPVPEGGEPEPLDHPGAPHGPAFLPHARAGAPHHGGGGPAHRLPQRRGRPGPGAGPAGNAPPGQPGAWRRLRLLGGLRGRDQRGDVCLHRHRRHPLGRGALGPGQRDDVPGPGPDWSGGGTPLL